MQKLSKFTCEKCQNVDANMSKSKCKKLSKFKCKKMQMHKIVLMYVNATNFKIEMLKIFEVHCKPFYL